MSVYTKNQKKSHYHFYRGSGALLIVETGITPTTNDKFSFGAWMYTKKFSDLINTKKFKRNYGIYGLLEKELFKNPKNHNQIITNFLRIGSADGNTTRFNYAWTCGINFQGIIPSREKGIAGIAFQQAINSNTFRLSKQIDSISTLKSEYGIELTYQDFVTPWLTLQPDVQYIFNPGATPGIKNALVIGLRAQIYL